jgi:serine kinase of HPr protein (carbohydrate metabolism regulator)
MSPIHASCVAINAKGVLITGVSGSGKSDLALRLMDRGAQLVSDDYTELTKESGRLIARPPIRLAGMLEVRGLGIITVPFCPFITVAMHIDLDVEVVRWREKPDEKMFLGLPIPSLPLNALEASAPIKVEWALNNYIR